MVFFNCNGCGEALKKNQVEKHSYRCRNCQVLSCVDCGKDFWGNDYQYHTKCMTEEEKYCGPGFVSKVNKGEAKQEQWIEKVQRAIDKSSSNPGLKRLLIRLKDYPNIPRKQQKFQNFLKNSLRVYDVSLCTQVWDTLMAHSVEEDVKKANAENNKQMDTVNGSANQSQAVNGSANQSDAVNGSGSSTQHSSEVPLEAADVKKSKREKKEERQKKSSKKEKKDEADLSQNGVEHGKKSKKRKHRDDEPDEANTNVLGQKKKKKKKASSEEIDFEPEVVVEGSDVKENNEPKTKKKKIKFDWETTITKVLEDKGEMSLKRLRKKVLNEFAALDATNYCHENLSAKFDKKVRKLARVQVLKDRAKLKET